MSDYQFEVGKEYRTRNGLPCVVIANDPAVGMVWRVLSCGGDWIVVIGRHAADAYKPVPPERTVDQRAFLDVEGHLEVVFGTRSEEYTVGDKASNVRWTIGSDGRPAYAVRLDENGEPMYRVEPVAECQNV